MTDAMLPEHPGGWLLFTTSLPAQTASDIRVRVWRSLRLLGAATLREGIAILPFSEEHYATLEKLAREIESVSGIAWLIELPKQRDNIETLFPSLFNRVKAYELLMSQAGQLLENLIVLEEPVARLWIRQLKRHFRAISNIDFFPGTARDRANQILNDLEAAIRYHYSPKSLPVPPSLEEDQSHPWLLQTSDYQQKTWATYADLWVDRIACAWLILRFIDPRARFVWIVSSYPYPDDVIGFDFEGATFAHTEDQVTFEVLLARFDLERDVALRAMAALVHDLDVGGAPVAESVGVESMLSGLKKISPHDDAFLVAAIPFLDALYHSFREQHFSLPETEA